MALRLCDLEGSWRYPCGNLMRVWRNVKSTLAREAFEYNGGLRRPALKGGEGGNPVLDHLARFRMLGLLRVNLHPSHLPPPYPLLRSRIHPMEEERRAPTGDWVGRRGQGEFPTAAGYPDVRVAACLAKMRGLPALGLPCLESDRRPTGTYSSVSVLHAIKTRS